MLRPLQLIVGLLLLILLEIAHAYFIMVSPGQPQQVDITHFLQDNIFYFRTIGWLIILFPIVFYLWLGSRRAKVLTLLGLALYLFIFYTANSRYGAPAPTHSPTEVATHHQP